MNVVFMCSALPLCTICLLLLSRRFHFIQNGSSKLVGSAVTTHVASANLAINGLAFFFKKLEQVRFIPISNNIIHSLRDAVRMLIKS